VSKSKEQLKVFVVTGDGVPLTRVTAGGFSAFPEGIQFYGLPRERGRGTELLAYFPRHCSVVLESALSGAAPSAMPTPAAPVEMVVGEALFEPGPTIGKVTINVTAGALPDLTSLREVLEQMRGKLPASDRNECLNAILHFVGVLAAPGSRPVAEDLMTISDLATAVSRMKHVAHKRLNE
jgi:hypothetical protein